MAYLLYKYFKGTDKSLSLVMLISYLISIPIAMAFEIVNLAPLALLNNDSLKQVFTSDQTVPLGIFDVFTFGEMVFVLWMIFKAKPIVGRNENTSLPRNPPHGV